MKLLSLTTVLVIINCWSAIPANAQSCYSHSDLASECANVIDVAVYGDVDRRRTEGEFAKDVGESEATIHNRFAATGTLVCRGNIACPTDGTKRCLITVEGSAQLTGDQKTITTAAHLFQDSKTCQQYSQTLDCTFSVQATRELVSRNVTKLIGQGYHCPTIPTADLDWAVMELSQPITEVHPYKIDKRAVDGLEQGGEVLAVCHSADFIRLRKGANGKQYTPKHFGKCQIKAVYRLNGAPIYLSTDCDSADFCSGGGLLSGDSDEPALLGVSIRNGEKKSDLENAVKNHTVNKRPFDEQTWGARYRPLSGDFLEAVKRAAEPSGPGKGN